VQEKKLIIVHVFMGGVVVVILYQSRSMLLHIKPLNALIKNNNNKFDMMCVGFDYGCRMRSKKKLNLYDM
jgi:hypothetical protein